MPVPECLSKAIAGYREEHVFSREFSEALDRLEQEGLAMVRDPAASLKHVRWSAASFLIHYIGSVLDDHRICEQEMGNIVALGRIFDLDEGDLLAMHRPAVAGLLRVEMEKMLADEHVDDLEVMHQADLQRALGLGYDDYLQLTQESIRPVVDLLLTQARGRSRQQQDEIIRRLQSLQTVIKVDPETMTATWPG